MLSRGLIQLATLFQNNIAKPTFYMLTLRVVAARVHVVLNGSFMSPIK